MRVSQKKANQNLTSERKMVSVEMNHSPWEMGDSGENWKSPMNHGGVSPLSKIMSTGALAEPGVGLQ